MIVPFSTAAILALLELNEAAKWACIVGFGLFALLLLLMSSTEAAREE